MSDMSDTFTGTHRVILPKDFFDPTQTFFGEDFDVDAPQADGNLNVDGLKPTVMDQVRKVVGSEPRDDDEEGPDLDVPGW